MDGRNRGSDGGANPEKGRGTRGAVPRDGPGDGPPDAAEPPRGAASGEGLADARPRARLDGPADGARRRPRAAPADAPADAGADPLNDSPAYWRRLGRQKDRIMSVRAEAASRRGPVAGFVIRGTRVLAHPAFLAAEIVFHAAWVAANSGVAGIRPWDPYPYQLLALIASAQALFFALLVLTQQTREAAVAELREETDLQVALHTERETTKLLRMLEEIHRALEIPSAERDEELRLMQQPLDPDRLRETLERELGE